MPIANEPGRAIVTVRGASLSSGGGDHTVVVAHTQGVWSSVRSTPSGAVERVTPVFTDGGAMVRLETDRGEELLVAGGGAWLT